jgi:hypothetical protein
MAMTRSRMTIWLARAAAALACLAVPAPATAQVRTEPSPASLVDAGAPSAVQALFSRRGTFMVAGGVVPGGHAAFFLDQNNSARPVATAAVQPVAWPDGTVGLRSAGASYRLDMPQGLACPLGQFVARDGLIVFTKPKFSDPDSRRAMLRAGLVRHRIAREFDGTQFETLLKAADFGATEPLPPALAQDIIARINDAHGISGVVMNASVDLDAMIGSYINSGMQVTYHVYLMPATGRVEIGGVPLRYFWKLDDSGAAAIFLVEMYSQSWPAGTHLAAPGAAPTQYDVVNFYQVAGLFQQLHENDAAGFTAFVDQACGGRAPRI